MRRRSLREVLYCVATLCIASFAEAQATRVTIPLNSGWRFLQADGVSGAEAPVFDDSRWAAVDIPHTWNRLGNDGNERSPLSNDVQGVGWYRLHFQTPRSAAGSRYFLQFDAVGAVADVWMNGHYLGKHAGAFSRFRFDASAFIKPSGDNVLAVKADNSRPQPGGTTQDVIPLSGDFFVFGGIYRRVALIVTQPVHVDLMDFGGPGLYAMADDIEPTLAKVQVSARLVNDASKPRRVVVDFAVEDAKGHVVDSKSFKRTASGSTALQLRLRVTHPHLWQGRRDPYLYRATMTIRSDTGAVLDRVTEPLGIRIMKFDPDHGFFLNGEHLALKGVSMHQDRPVKGWAISCADQQQDFDLLTDLGANAVRLAHYQHDQCSYELADAQGVVVWAEIPVVNKVSFDGSPANEALTANAQQQLIELVRQNYNHPSIAVWSVGNEVDLSAIQIKGPSRAAALLKSLNELAKREDASRATTLADCCEAAEISSNAARDMAGIAPRDTLVGIADTIGYNRYFGWYVGKFADFGVMLDRAHLLHPHLPIAVSEYGAGAALTQHSDDPAGGPINPHGRPHPEEYQNLYHEESWKQLENRDYLWGVYIWNLFDFSSDSRREGDLSDINEKGLISYDRQTRKDAFYFYRANWNSQPTLHLAGRRYVDRAYAVIDVKAYSNGAEAHLSLNGNDLGAAPCSNGICLWRSVHLSRGANELSATARIGGSAIADSVHWTLSHSAGEVRIKAGDITGYISRDAQRYGSDMYFVGGAGSGVNPPDTAAADRRSVSADDAPLYDSYREGEFSYRVPLPNGRYRVVLMFEEPMSIAAGERVFDVTANGVVKIEGFDILAAAGGKLKAVDRAFDATVNDGVLSLAFRPRRGNALVSALSITPLDAR